MKIVLIKGIKMPQRNFATGLQHFFYNFAMNTITYMCDASHKI